MNRVQQEYGYSPSTESLPNPGDVICVTCLGLLQPHSKSTLVKQVVIY